MEVERVKRRLNSYFKNFRVYVTHHLEGTNIKNIIIIANIIEVKKQNTRQRIPQLNKQNRKSFFTRDMAKWRNCESSQEKTLTWKICQKWNVQGVLTTYPSHTPDANNCANMHSLNDTFVCLNTECEWEKTSITFQINFTHRHQPRL